MVGELVYTFLLGLSYVDRLGIWHSVIPDYFCLLVADM